MTAPLLVSLLAALSSNAPPPAAPPVYHVAPPVSRPAPALPPVARPVPAAPSTRVEEPRNPHGFSMPNDVGVPPAVRTAPAPVTRLNPPRIPYPSGPHRHWYGPIVGNPHQWPGWGWNNGVIWYPVPVYWGGGFWGPWYYGAPGLLLDGSIVYYADHAIYPSYQIEPSSPGAELLEDYGLQQTQCGPPNLVVIWGPGNSVVCAYPNNLVAAGNYELDPATLTLQSLGAPNR